MNKDLIKRLKKLREIADNARESLNSISVSELDIDQVSEVINNLYDIIEIYEEGIDSILKDLS
jgi:hypothetical protein